MAAKEYRIGDVVSLVKGREGVIKFHGEIQGREGTYYGVEVTFGKGKHSGKYNGTRYFSCAKKQGLFVEDRHIIAKIGDEYDELSEEEAPPTPKKKRKGNKTNVPTYNDENTADYKVMKRNEAKKLMKLSKVDLIRKCKQAGIVCLGSKEKIVEALLTTKTKQNHFFAGRSISLVDDQQKREKAITIEQCNKYFLSGFIRNIFSEYPPKRAKKYIKSLKQMIVEYAGRGAIIAVFDLCPRTYRSCIRNDGSLIVRAKIKKRKQFIFGCSKGFKPHTGIHRFSIKINKILKTKSKSDREKDEIGVISDKKFFTVNTMEDIAMWNVDCNSYYISLGEVYGTHKIQSGTWNDDKVKLLSNDSEGIKRKDIVTIQLDTNRWKMYIEKNGERYCESFKVQPGCTYYPAISSCTKLNEYEVMLY